MRTATPASVRQVNRAIAMTLIRAREPISRAELSRLTGIYKSNVSDIIDELIADGLVVEYPGEAVGRGRRPILLKLNDESCSVAGVLIESDTTAVAIAGIRGRIDGQRAVKTPKEAADLAPAIAAALTDLGAEPTQVGIAVPGMVDHTTGAVLWVPSLPSYNGFPLADSVRASLGIPAVVDNDCNLGALSERWLSADTEPARDLVFLNIGDNGVGGGVVLGGDVFRGHDGRFAAELGHVVIDPAGPRCRCGRRGCWERFVCNRAVWAQFAPGKSYRPERFEAMLDDAVAGDRAARRAVDRLTAHLALGIANITSVLNPSEVLISGRVLRAWALVEQPLLQAVRVARAQTVVRPARLPGEMSLLHGAICAALDQFYSHPKFGWTRSPAESTP